MTHRFILTLLVFATFCRGPLVEEDYASIGGKSINGIDSFAEILKSTGRTVRTSAYFTKETATSDVIVHFEPDFGYDEEVYRNLEAWMSGLDLNPEDLTDKDKVVHDSRTYAVPDTESKEAHGDPAEKTDEEETADNTNTEKEVDLKPVTLIYFLRDTTASAEFWRKLEKSLKDYPEERAFARYNLERTEFRESPPQGEIPTLFGFRSLLKGQKEVHQARSFSSDEIEDLPPWFPYRILHSGEPALSIEERFAYRTILLGDDHDLIREFFLKRGRVILVYNSESFLNYAQAKTAQRKFAEKFTTYALKDAPKDGTISIIQRAPVPPRTQKEKEESPFRIFTVFPLNVIFFQLLIFLLVFLLSRAKVGSPLREEAPAGSRDFTEHFTALGNLIRKTGTRS